MNFLENVKKNSLICLILLRKISKFLEKKPTICQLQFALKKVLHSFSQTTIKIKDFQKKRKLEIM